MVARGALILVNGHAVGTLPETGNSSPLGNKDAVWQVKRHGPSPSGGPKQRSSSLVASGGIDPGRRTVAYLYHSLSYMLLRYLASRPPRRQARHRQHLAWPALPRRHHRPSGYASGNLRQTTLGATYRNNGAPTVTPLTRAASSGVPATTRTAHLAPSRRGAPG